MIKPITPITPITPGKDGAQDPFHVLSELTLADGTARRSLAPASTSRGSRAASA